MPADRKIWLGFVLCWTAAAIIAVADAVSTPALVAFTAPLWISGILKLVEGLLGINGKKEDE